MGLRIGTNIPSLNAQRNLGNVQEEMNKSLNRLSSGNQIVNAADDAAGLSISQNLHAQERGLAQALKNANNGVSLIQTAEGGMNEISNIIIRMRELGVQAASDTIGDTERSFVQREVDQLIQEVDRIAESTNFNGTKLLNGSTEGGVLQFQVGTFAEESNRIQFDTSKTDVRADNIGISGLDLTSRSSAADQLSRLDTALDRLNSQRAELGAAQNRLQSTISNLGISKENIASARSGIADTDVAQETAQLAKSNILQNASISVLAQANNTPTAALRLING